MLYELSLFTGAGGGLLASKYLLGWKTIGMVEIDEYCQKVLQQRQKDGLLDKCPLFGDINDFIKEGYAESYSGLVDVITAGFPCQPFSVEGKRRSEKDNRNLWPETIEVIRRVSPELVLLENVRGIQKYLPVVIRDLRKSGYIVERPLAQSAANRGFLHIRPRLWIFAHKHSNGWKWKWDKFIAPARKRPQTWAEFERLVQNILQSCVSSRGGRGIHDGMANRMDRLKAIGNGQVPQVVATAWRILIRYV